MLSTQQINGKLDIRPHCLFLAESELARFPV